MTKEHLDETDSDPELRALVEAFCETCERDSFRMLSFLKQLEESQRDKLLRYLAGIAFEAGLLKPTGGKQ